MVELGGRPLIGWVLAAFEEAGIEPVVVVTKPDHGLGGLDGLSGLDGPSARIVEEPLHPRHPLLGIITALEAAHEGLGQAVPEGLGQAAHGAAVVCCPCDVPFVPSELLARLASTEGAAVMPRADGRLQPLIARYGRESLPALRAALAAEDSMTTAAEHLRPVVLDAAGPADAFLNINSPEDLATAERILAAGADASTPG